MNPLREEYEFFVEKISKFTCIIRMAGNDGEMDAFLFPKAMLGECNVWLMLYW